MTSRLAFNSQTTKTNNLLLIQVSRDSKQLNIDRDGGKKYPELEHLLTLIKFHNVKLHLFIFISLIQSVQMCCTLNHLLTKALKDNECPS